MRQRQRMLKCAVLAALFVLGGACTKINAPAANARQTHEAVVAAASAADNTTISTTETTANTTAAVTTTTTVTTTITTTTQPQLRLRRDSALRLLTKAPISTQTSPWWR